MDHSQKRVQSSLSSSASVENGPSSWGGQAKTKPKKKVARELRECIAWMIHRLLHVHALEKENKMGSGYDFEHCDARRTTSCEQ